MTIKHCIITGGSSGIGLASARKLVEEGFNITIIARREAQLAAAKSLLTESLTSNEQRIITFSADVSDRNEITDAIVNAIEILAPPKRAPVDPSGVGIAVHIVEGADDVELRILNRKPLEREPQPVGRVGNRFVERERARGER